MSTSEHPQAEIAARGEAIFRREIECQLAASDRGKFVVLDISSGEFEVDENDLIATKRLLARKPNGVLYGVRVGFPAAYRLGGFSTESP